MPMRGQQILYRPVPRDFPQTFIRVGWFGIEKHYRAHARTIARWIDICGREALVAARADYVRENRKRRRRLVA